MNTNSHPTSIGPAATGQTGRVVLFAAGGTLLFAVLSAIAWANTRDEAPSAAVPPAVIAPTASEASFGRPAESTGVGDTIYIVRSEEQGEAMRAALQEANQILGAHGELRFQAAVVVAPLDVQAAEVMNSISEDNRILEAVGRPQTAIVDLRAD